MAERRLGIFLGRAGAEAAYVLARRKGRYTVLKRAEVAAAGPLWEGDRAGLGPLFKALARALPGEARRADVRQHLAIPDPLVTEDRLAFRDLPDDAGEARELILWRVARELRRPADTLACAWQVEKVEGEETRVLVRMIGRDLLDALTDAAQAAGFFPARIDGWSGYMLNRTDLAGAASGARIWADADWWALMCWARADEAAGGEGETLVHAEWRDEGGAVAIAEKAGRLAKSFALSRGAGALPVTLDMEEALAGEVAARLGGEVTDAVARADCVALDPA